LFYISDWTCDKIRRHCRTSCLGAYCWCCSVYGSWYLVTTFFIWTVSKAYLCLSLYFLLLGMFLGVHFPFILVIAW